MGNTSGGTASQQDDATTGSWHDLAAERLEHCKKTLEKVDSSMTSLAYSLDTMHAAVMEEYQKRTQIDNVKRTEIDDFTLQLLFKIERTVLYDQDWAVESLRDFLHSTSDSIRFFDEIDIKEFRNFSLDTYMSKAKESRIHRPILSRIGEEKIENAQLKEDIERLYRHEINFHDEKQIMLEKHKKLEKLINTLQSQRNEQDSCINNLTVKLQSLTMENKVRHQLEEDLKEEKVKNDNLNETINDLQNENDLLGTSVMKANQNIEFHESKETDKDSKLEEMIRKLRQVQKEYDDLQMQYTNDQKKTLMMEQRNEMDKQTTEELKTNYQQIEKENTNLTQEVKRLLVNVKDAETDKAEKVRLESENEKMKCQNNQMQIELETIRQGNISFEEMSKAEQKTRKELTNSLDSKEQEIIVLQEKLQEAEKSKTTLISTSAEIEEIKRLNEQLQAKNNCLEKALEVKEQDLQSLQKQNNADEVERQRLLKESEEIKCQNKLLQKRLEDTLHEQKSLLQKLEKGHNEQKRLENEKDQEKVRLQALEEEKENLDGLLAAKHREYLGLEERTSETIKQLEENNEHLNEENISLKQELETFKRKKNIQVQIYYQRRSGLIAAVEEELLCLLKSKMEADGKVELEFIKRLQAADVNPNTPLLLLCVSASRIGTDAANTIHGLNLTSTMWLLIFHHKDIHALPNQASYQVLTGKEYTSLGGICDLAFLTGKGLYSCPMNESSIDKIVNFIDTEGVRNTIENT